MRSPSANTARITTSARPGTIIDNFGDRRGQPLEQGMAVADIAGQHLIAVIPVFGAHWNDFVALNLVLRSTV
jgi:hypothetical protein